jgi:dynein heavy chain
MLSEFDPTTMLSASINFNFYTTSAMLMTTMGIPLVKKTGTNYGPPGQAKLVYFVDDVNLPEVDPYDTQVYNQCDGKTHKNHFYFISSQSLLLLLLLF